MLRELCRLLAANLREANRQLAGSPDGRRVDLSKHRTGAAGALHASPIRRPGALSAAASGRRGRRGT